MEYKTIYRKATQNKRVEFINVKAFKLQEGVVRHKYQEKRKYNMKEKPCRDLGEL